MIGLRELERVLQPLRAKLGTMVMRAVVESVKKADGSGAGGGLGGVKVYGLAGLPDEPLESFQHVGYLCVPPAGAEAIVARLQADPSMAVALVIDDRLHRPRKGPGAAADFKPLEPVFYTLNGTVVFHGTQDGHAYVGGADESVSGAADNLVALAKKVDDIISALDTVFRTSWTPVAQDGGAALKTAYAAAFTQAPDSVACERTHAG